MKTREELIDLAIGEVVRNVINFPEKVQARLLGQDMGPLRKKLTDAAVTALEAGGVSPTAPDEREALALRRILAEQGLDDDGASPHSWRCENGDRFPDYCTCVADIIDAILAAGFRRSREATTEPQPVLTESETDAAERAVNDALRRLVGRTDWADDDTAIGGMSAHIVSAALEAVEASRSPKPTEVER